MGIGLRLLVEDIESRQNSIGIYFRAGVFEVEVNIQQGRAGLLVDFERVDEPVGLFESGGVVLHEGVASACLRGAGAACRPDCAGPVAAEGDVEDDLQLVEMVVNVARFGKSGRRGTPSRRIRSATSDIPGDARAREEPDIDDSPCPFGSVDAASSIVEAVAIGGVVVTSDGTAGVGRLARSFDVAVGSLDFAAEPEGLDGAAIAGVEGHLVGGLVVDAFNDVDFAVAGPVGAEHPESWPRPADTAWHMGQVKNHQPLGVFAGTLQANTLSARVVGNVCVLNADVD